jgi:hypothetical protein
MSDLEIFSPEVGKAIAASPSHLARVLADLPEIVARLIVEGGPQEIFDGRNQTNGLRAYVRKAKLGLAAQQAASEAWIR